ncbi:MAG: T9SS type A sorting domain-containing protein [Chitinophagales bacterium]|nr:T9SS type A sorting domain-containing protein [Chitinophagales bacterium]
MKTFVSVFFLLFFLQAASQTCYTISNRTNGNGNPGTCGTPNCSGNAKTGHIDINFGASCPGVIPSLVLTAVTTGSVPNPYCFDPGNCISAGNVRYCFRGNNLPSSGFMTLRFTLGASAWNCTYNVNGGSGSILPVLLTGFEARITGSNVLLNWRTEQEYNNDRFIIERSNNNNNFIEIGTVTGNGNSPLPTDYRYTDPNPVKAVFFYRLKQMDSDGHFTYSATRRIDNRIAGLQINQIYPNPASDNLVLFLHADKPDRLEVSIYNCSGQRVIREDKQVSRGDQNWKIALPYLRPGLYELVLITASDELLTEKIVVRN